jgi:DNA-binding GntR family transcriptional regulator
VTTPIPSPPLQCDHGLRRPFLVQSLLTEVFQGRLRAGQHLVTQDLADRFGVSHTPIREALIALAGIGIIDLLPNRGAVVRKVTARDVYEICQVRRVLECEATRSACGRIDPASLEALAADLERLIRRLPRATDDLVAEARGLDSRVHDTIASSCGNQFLANELGRLTILFRAFRDVTYAHDTATRFASGRFVEEAREHLDVVVALRDGEPEAAAEAMSLHILTAVEHWGRLRAVADADADADSDSDAVPDARVASQPDGDGRPRARVADGRKARPRTSQAP